MAAAADAHGRQASTPSEIPSRGWLDVGRRVKEQIRRDRLSIIAAGVAFYALLSIFPGLVALVAMYGLFADPAQIERHVASLSAILPPEAAQVVMSQLHDLASTNRAALGLGAIGGLVVALWSASSAVRTLMEWNIGVDEAMFLGGLEKGEFLRSFEPDFYFDDQRRHVDSARAHVAAGHVPFGVANLR